VQGKRSEKMYHSICVYKRKSQCVMKIYVSKHSDLIFS